MSVLRVETIISKLFDFLKKEFSINFFGHERKKYGPFPNFFSPRSVKIQFMCPEEVFRKNFLEENFIFFLGFERVFCGLRKETLQHHLQKLIFSNIFFELKWKCFRIDKKFQHVVKNASYLPDKGLGECFFLKICFHKKNPISRKKCFQVVAKMYGSVVQSTFYQSRGISLDKNFFWKVWFHTLSRTLNKQLIDFGKKLSAGFSKFTSTWQHDCFDENYLIRSKHLFNLKNFQRLC